MHTAGLSLGVGFRGGVGTGGAQVDPGGLQYVLRFGVLDKRHYREVAAVDRVFLLGELERLATMAFGLVVVQMVLDGFADRFQVKRRGERTACRIHRIAVRLLSAEC